MRTPWMWLAALAACGGSSEAPPKDAPVIDAPAAAPDLAHSSSIALSSDGATLYVVNADADSVSIVDAHARTLTSEISLAAAPPAQGSGSDGAYTPSVMPRTLALSPDGGTLYVSGERASALFAIDSRDQRGHARRGRQRAGGRRGLGRRQVD